MGGSLAFWIAMAARRVWLGSAILGIERRSASVYGMRMSSNSVAVGADSTTCEAEQNKIDQ